MEGCGSALGYILVFIITIRQIQKRHNPLIHQPGMRLVVSCKGHPSAGHTPEVIASLELPAGSVSLRAAEEALAGTGAVTEDNAAEPLERQMKGSSSAGDMPNLDGVGHPASEYRTAAILRCPLSTLLT